MNYDEMSVHSLLEQFHVGCSREIIDDAELLAIESALRRKVIEEASVGTCEWKENENGMWDTSCENIFVFEEDGPEENGQKFCCYCGKPLKAVPFVYPTEEETP